MRAERLLATMLLMQRRGVVTAAEIAAGMGVSVPTARRDLDALALAGVPVYAKQGRGGGWSLVGGARTDLTGFSVGEAVALFAALGSLGRADSIVARKLRQALPEPFRGVADAASDAMLVDPTPWGREREPEPEALLALVDAVAHRKVMVIEYVDAAGRQSRRQIGPLGLVEKAGVWYLLANTNGGRRHFKVARIAVATPTGDLFARPASFDLRRAWERVLAGPGEW
ncbi:WYL domain-containing protein [Demequina sp.]|uniref:helix-turn-helix transcriptional regulator n=1 Tax=Demequina sp. TaxID=2050685 RepID=UPI0025BEAF57|nr:WYL domain-containing protein [Demequina sp.]